MLAVLALLISAPAAMAPREVNVTANSALGWTPTVDDEIAARAFALAYFAAVDAARYKQAYAMLAPRDQAVVPRDALFRDKAAFARQAGAVVDRTIVKVTWTKDPPSPAPGIYAAIDVASRFAHITRHCGYLIAYRAPGDDRFRVMREEANFIDDATAAMITRDQSPAALDATWRELARACPNQ